MEKLHTGGAVRLKAACRLVVGSGGYLKRARGMCYMLFLACSLALALLNSLRVNCAWFHALNGRWTNRYNTCFEARSSFYRVIATILDIFI